ncbi:MAG: hypothetical protein ABEK01_02195 [Candidatus Nanohaloarchaea archaeon]
MSMKFVSYMPVDVWLQAMLVVLTGFFLYRSVKIYRSVDVGGSVGNASSKFALGLFFILLAEIMGFAVVLNHQPFTWSKLYAVTPQIAGFLLVFMGITDLLRSFGVI